MHGEIVADRRGFIGHSVIGNVFFEEYVVGSFASVGVICNKYFQQQVMGCKSDRDL